MKCLSGSGCHKTERADRCSVAVVVVAVVAVVGGDFPMVFYKSMIWKIPSHPPLPLIGFPVPSFGLKSMLFSSSGVAEIGQPWRPTGYEFSFPEFLLLLLLLLLFHLSLSLSLCIDGQNSTRKETTRKVSFEASVTEARRH